MTGINLTIDIVVIMRVHGFGVSYIACTGIFNSIGPKSKFFSRSSAFGLCNEMLYKRVACERSEVRHISYPMSKHAYCD